MMKKISRNFVPACLLFSCIFLMSSSDAVAPFIEKPLPRVIIMAGERAIFETTVRAIPEASFNCYLDNREVPNGYSEIDKRYYVSYNGEEAKFIIIESRRSDSGTVEFKFKNVFGTTTSSADLTVLNPPSL